MAMTMVDKAAITKNLGEWPAGLRHEFERKAQSPNGCVGSELVSESGRVRVWMIRLQPGQHFGFHRHVLDHFWSAISGGRDRQHQMDGSTLEYTYQPGETRHESCGPGEDKVHDPGNIGDEELMFMTVEFLDSANQPIAIPQAVRSTAA